MKRSEEKLRSLRRSTSDSDIERFSNSNNESHQMTLNRPFGDSGKSESLENISIEYHLTVKITNESLSRRELGLLLDVLNYQAVHFGITFAMQLAMFELYFRLLGNKRNSLEIKEKYIRKTLTVSEVILESLKTLSVSLDSENRTQLSNTAKILLSNYVMSKRTYGSRFKTYRPEKFFIVSTVPVDIKFLKRNSNTQPYSGYCKGYGESHPSAHRQKLKPSQEYDGTVLSPEQIESLSLFERCTDKVHILSDFLILKFEEEKQKKE